MVQPSALRSVLAACVFCVGAASCVSQPDPVVPPLESPQAETPSVPESPRGPESPPPVVASPCMPGAGVRCIKADTNGQPNPSGTFRAQCTGTFPDYLVPETQFPPLYEGPWFELAQNFPKTPPPPSPLPWTGIDFRVSEAEATRYLYALRDYSLEGMVEADFVPAKNSVRPWYHVPLMNFGPNRRELAHGLTRERPLTGPELGLKPGVRVDNYAIGFYNEIGAATIGGVWLSERAPDLSKATFAEGSMVFKILFSAAKPKDFQTPPGDLMAGAPSWQIATGNGVLTSIRLLQMDVAVRDARAGTTGWVFGTFAFEPTATDPDPWRRLRPVGLAWGNDPGYTPADQADGKPLEEAYVSAEIPSYAEAHLGWAGRVNGPVDNPISACISCHSTAQYPVAAPIAPFSSRCDSDAKKLHWFRNLRGDEPFGAVNAANCLPTTPPGPLTALDFSLQMQVAVQSALQFRDVNPCGALALRESRTLAPTSLGTPGDAPRVSRGETKDDGE